MGNKETLKYESFHSSFKILSADVSISNLDLSNTCNLARHKKTNQLFLIKYIHAHRYHGESKIMDILINKEKMRSKYVTEVFEWWKNDQGDSCGLGGSGGVLIMFLMENYVDLELTSIGERQIQKILECLLKGLKYYHKVNHQYPPISLKSILKSNQNFVMVDPWLLDTPSSQSNDAKFKAPERLMWQKDLIGTFNNFYANIYEAGLLILKLFFQKQFDKINTFVQQNDGTLTKLMLLLETIQNQKIKQQLKIMLNLNPSKRIQIYDHFIHQKINLSNSERLKISTKNIMNSSDNNYKEHDYSDRLNNVKTKKRVSLSKQKSHDKRQHNRSLGQQKIYRNILVQKSMKIKGQQKTTNFNTSVKDSVLTYAELLPGTKAYESKFGFNTKNKDNSNFNEKSFGILKLKVKGKGTVNEGFGSVFHVAKNKETIVGQRFQ